ncbi:signal-induced proliferation-associated 1-like protein 2 [Petromyzon marinus]|uniref:signal-induced proliferation-associated 1-like protein 2 n=1 Tax=Petromyzon marinus TaxID=7757 RepID=UPI003F6F0987
MNEHAPLKSSSPAKKGLHLGRSLKGSLAQAPCPRDAADGAQRPATVFPEPQSPKARSSVSAWPPGKEPRASDKSAKTRLSKYNSDPSHNAAFRTKQISLKKKIHDCGSKSTESSHRPGAVEAQGSAWDDGAGVSPGASRRCFAHYDVQSILFRADEDTDTSCGLAASQNMTTGASAASQPSSPLLNREPNATFPPAEEDDGGDGKSNDLLLSCTNFLNEIGPEEERCVHLCGGGAPSTAYPGSCRTDASVAVLEPESESGQEPEPQSPFCIEHEDVGARYYRKFFYQKEHQNYVGVSERLGPVVVSLLREQIASGEDVSSPQATPQFLYRVIVRRSQLYTLRGAVMEEAVASAARHGTPRGLPARDVLEATLPELHAQQGLRGLKLAANTHKLADSLLRIDEQELCSQLKVGIMYCRAGQSSEDEMYNNEDAGPALTEFLHLLGDCVRLKGFNKFRAQLDNKMDSTGTHSLYTTFQGYEIMFHVSTMLPYMPNDRQQVLRKRHIGNDIVTVIFQEPGSLPFTARCVRSQFQHVFIVVRVVTEPGEPAGSYRVAVSRSKGVPAFGPQLPQGGSFRDPSVFRAFLLTKIVNAEKAAHKCEKFHAMATRARHESLRELAEKSVTTTALDANTRFAFPLNPWRKEKLLPRPRAELLSRGALVWDVLARDFCSSCADDEDCDDVPCFLALSASSLVLVEKASGRVVFHRAIAQVLGWTPGQRSLRIEFEEGGSLRLASSQKYCDEISGIVQRLEVLCTPLRSYGNQSVQQG